MLRFNLQDHLLNPKEIHPQSIYDTERRLAKNFVMGHPGSGSLDACPISGEERSEVLFSKWGQQYAICPKTWNLSLAATPSAETLKDYFFTSELAEYRSSDEYQFMATRLRSELWLSHLQWLEARAIQYLEGSSLSLIDWGSKFSGWVEKLNTSELFGAVYTHEPLPPVQSQLADAPVDVVCLHDAFQREPEPAELLKKVHATLKDDGLMTLSCRSGSGFDVLSLREHSDSIFPYDHVCLPSPDGISELLEKTGFEILELTTPGLMDISLLAEGDIPSDQFFQRYLVQALPKEQYEAFQKALMQFRLSSHLRVVARKR